MKIHPGMMAALALALLAGCKTTKNDKQETFIPLNKQKDYLSQTKPPQLYGFEVYATGEGGIGFRGEARLHPRHKATTDFVSGGAPVVQVTAKVFRKKMNALLDVSSPSSWMEFSTAREFDAQFLGWQDQPIPYRGVYNTGGVNAFAGIVGQLRIKQLFIENIPVYIRMATGSIGPLARGIKVPEVDAVLGWDCLHLFEYIQFDLREGRVTFSATTPYKPNTEMVMAEAQIVNLPNYGLAVAGAIFGEGLPILLDFAGDYHFARGDKRVTATKQVSIGEIVYRQLPTLVLPVHNSPPRAGRKMLEPYIVTICPNAETVYFERRPGEE